MTHRWATLIRALLRISPRETRFPRFAGCEPLILIDINSVSKEFRFDINKWHEYAQKITYNDKSLDTGIKFSSPQCQIDLTKCASHSRELRHNCCKMNQWLLQTSTARSNCRVKYIWRSLSTRSGLNKFEICWHITFRYMAKYKQITLH